MILSAETLVVVLPKSMAAIKPPPIPRRALKKPEEELRPFRIPPASPVALTALPTKLAVLAVPVTPVTLPAVPKIPAIPGPIILEKMSLDSEV